MKPGSTPDWSWLDFLKGALDYYRFPERRASWGGPFNGQPARQALFHELIDRLRPKAIVEAGTYLGTTTELMARTGLPVFTIEANARSCGFATARLWRQRKVVIRRGDSREALRNLLDGALSRFRTQILFAYLDAHWYSDLPLGEEIEIVFSRCAKAIVMIDDFQVPFDSGYGYDDYGAGRALTAGYIAPLVAGYGLKAFYPSTPSSKEGGARRGCVVLAKSTVHDQLLGSIPLVRGADAPSIPSSTGHDALPHAR